MKHYIVYAGKSQISLQTIVVVVASISVSALLFVAGYCYRRRKQRKKYNVIQEENESLQFDFATIEGATDKFSDDNKLGEGGFGVVYKFRVLILEILTGEKNSSFCQANSSEDLLSYAWKHWRDETPLELLDPTLGDSNTKNEVIRRLHIGLHCVQDNPADRPTMATVVLMLNNDSVILPLPQRPA
uniref:Uncharacterized protein n=1 Tax=Quercus lobata TaxID=97700 RepID=A0A7N2LUJ3_QUELO